MSAYFLFVSRNSADPKQAYPVPKLVFDDEFDANTCKLRWDIGEMHQAERKRKRETSLDRVPPTGEEVKFLHKFINENYTHGELNNSNVME